MSELKWTIQPTQGTASLPRVEFATKGEAVRAMLADVEPKSPIRRDGRNYTYNKKRQ